MFPLHTGRLMLSVRAAHAGLRSVGFLAAFATLMGLIACPGCGLLPGGKDTGSAELKRFESQEEFEDYVRTEIGRRNSSVVGFDRVALSEGNGGSDSAGDGGAPPSPAAPTGGVAEDGDDQEFSGTTIQEVGVDEADVVKTDGNFVYVLSSAGAGSVLRIVDVAQPEAMNVVSSTEIRGFGRDLYLHGDTIVALTSSGGGFYYWGGGGIEIDVAMAPGDVGDSDVRISEPAEPAIFPFPDISYERPSTILTVVDVAQRSEPVILSEIKFDGSLSSSRMIDGVVHLVLANYQDYYLDVMPLLGQSSLDVDSIDPEFVLPRFTRTHADGSEESGDVLTWEQLYRPLDPDGFGLVYVASVDLDADAAFSAVGVVAQPGLIYSSRQALYLTNTNYDFSGELRETTNIYKFAYADRGATPVAAGFVPGRVLNQYSMGEHSGFLRVATTVGPTFGFFGPLTPPSNNVFVLGQVDTSLDVVGSVTGIAPRETIQSARFVGTRGFVVTFEQIDPLFTLDLSDPTNPRVIGELKVPGFSTFLVPIDDDHLLAVGRYVPEPGAFGPWGVQLSIFDVSDFANPALKANLILGDETGAYSEALSDPKAFTYFAQRGLVALPLSIYNDRIFFPEPGIDFDFDDEGGSVDGGGATGNSGSSSGSDGVAPDVLSPPPDGSGDSDVAVVDSDDIDPFVPEGFEGLVVFSVSVDGGFTELGRISTRFEEAGFFWSSFTRGVFIGDEVLAVTDRGLRAADVNAIASTQVDLMFESTQINGSGSGVTEDGGTVSDKPVPAP
jgi:uncharacterized secreted protein with C-terminal beta-propeller domain